MDRTTSTAKYITLYGDAPSDDKCIPPYPVRRAGVVSGMPDYGHAYRMLREGGLCNRLLLGGWEVSGPADDG